jgi:uncharacterized protein YdeI (YjbR/CyaY-like superfamily)
MAKKDKRIDAYISKSADFAKPILTHLRELVHKACPEVEETLKWSFPHFDYKGIMCSMAAFKQHCAFTFWKAPLIKDTHKILGRDAMGHFGHIKSLKDLPSDKIMLDYLKQAVKLNDEGVKKEVKPKATEKKELEVPDYFITALKKNKKAFIFFENSSYSYKKEYLEWITEAKTEETRNKRMATAIEWIAEEKHRLWKYQK